MTAPLILELFLASLALVLAFSRGAGNPEDDDHVNPTGNPNEVG